MTSVTPTMPIKKGVILPRKGLHELKKLLSEAAEAGEAQTAPVRTPVRRGHHSPR